MFHLLTEDGPFISHKHLNVPEHLLLAAARVQYRHGCSVLKVNHVELTKEKKHIPGSLVFGTLRFSMGAANSFQPVVHPSPDGCCVQ
jgi:hypothetical protein